ncbi:MAG: hypothetical protein V4850_08725 [Myxococcota bacterium]
MDARGTRRWRVPAPDGGGTDVATFNGAAVGRGAMVGALLLVGGRDMLHALDTRTGAVRWSPPWVGGLGAVLPLGAG